MRFGIYLPEDKKPIFTLRGTDDTPRAEIEKIAISIEGPKIHFGMEDEDLNRYRNVLQLSADSILNTLAPADADTTPVDPSVDDNLDRVTGEAEERRLALLEIYLLVRPDEATTKFGCFPTSQTVVEAVREAINELSVDTAPVTPDPDLFVRLINCLLDGVEIENRIKALEKHES